VLGGNRRHAIEAGPFLAARQEVADLVVAPARRQAGVLRDVAAVRDGPPPASAMSGTAR
jgi:multidrug efflux pump subunit AcrB